MVLDCELNFVASRDWLRLFEGSCSLFRKSRVILRSLKNFITATAQHHHTHYDSTAGLSSLQFRVESLAVYRGIFWRSDDPLDSHLSLLGQSSNRKAVLLITYTKRKLYRIRPSIMGE